MDLIFKLIEAYNNILSPTISLIGLIISLLSFVVTVVTAFLLYSTIKITLNQNQTNIKLQRLQTLEKRLDDLRANFYKLNFNNQHGQRGIEIFSMSIYAKGQKYEPASWVDLMNRYLQHSYFSQLVDICDMYNLCVVELLSVLDNLNYSEDNKELIIKSFGNFSHRILSRIYNESYTLENTFIELKLVPAWKYLVTCRNSYEEYKHIIFK